MSQGTPVPRHRVLVAEDTETIALLFVGFLQEAGYEVALARDGQECLDMVPKFNPHLLVLDLMMPKVHGIEVMKRLRADEATRDVGILVCSAKSFKVDQEATADLGAVGFLEKPISRDTLLGAVSAFFGAGAPLSVDETSADAGKQTGDLYEPILETERGRLALWGTRGSIPTPGAAFLRHGGNTSCMEIQHGGETFIFDAGSGIRELGLSMMQRGPHKVHLFITHTHWDHIQGFPFFTPAYVRGFDITVYGAEGFGKSLERVFQGQLDQEYFPVQMEDMNARVEFRHLVENPVEVGDVKVYWEYAQHPGATVGYKIEVGGKTLSWFPDNEFLHGYVGSPEELTLDHDLVVPYRKVIELLTNVDVLIHEAQYTNDEYPAKIGWGHSSVSNAALLASMARVRRWIVTHHDPMHDDRFLETKLNLTRQQLARLGRDIPVSHAYDGMVEYL